MLGATLGAAVTDIDLPDAPDDPPVVVWDSSGLLLVELLDESTVAFLRRRWERREGLAK